jgi:hypothetical protein
MRGGSEDGPLFGVWRKAFGNYFSSISDVMPQK